MFTLIHQWRASVSRGPRYSRGPCKILAVSALATLTTDHTHLKAQINMNMMH